MARLLCVLCLGFFLCGAAQAKMVGEKTKQAIVKVYTTSVEPDYFDPWRMLSPRNSTGSGVIIEGDRILTNAHVVANSRFIQLQKYGEAKKFKAHVQFVSHDSDLALLQVEDKAFFEGVKPLKLGKLPYAQEQVVVLGYPMGGNSLSITQGVLSRIEHIRYAHSGRALLAGQIDAAINPGNSGGPVVKGDKVVGIVMQSLSGRNSESLGYMVPPVMIRHFLTDAEDGQLSGIPELGVVNQSLENPGMKTYLGLAEDDNGSYVNRVFPRLEERADIRAGDIVVAVNGHPIAGDQTVEFRSNERTNWQYFIDIHQMGDGVQFTLLRDGKKMVLSVPLFESADDHMVVPLKQYGTQPQYIIFGGIVFTPLTLNLMQRWGKSWQKTAPVVFLSRYEGLAEFSGQGAVVALKVLAGDVNEGYHNFQNQLVSTVNGQTFDNFSEFVELIETNQEPYIAFVDSRGYELVIDAEQAVREQPQILLDYGVQNSQFIH